MPIQLTAAHDLTRACSVTPGRPRSGAARRRRLRLHLGSIAFAVVGSLLGPADSWADQLRLHFAGVWRFYDSYSDAPDYWNAMNASGVFDGSPLIVSLLVNDGDINPDPGIGLYRVSRSQLRVGGVILTSTPTWLQLSNATYGSEALMVGRWVGPRAGPYKGEYLQLSYWGPPLESDALGDLLPSLSGAGLSLLFVGYGSDTCGLCMGVSELTLISVERGPGARKRQRRVLTRAGDPRAHER